MTQNYLRIPTWGSLRNVISKCSKWKHSNQIASIEVSTTIFQEIKEDPFHLTSITIIDKPNLKCNL